ncbi:zinc finger and BTB domain-containing protein 11 [Brienomyrus brachyistius]|uniref:zinc finger and BTB domain-containing protein 11 n=1 Tax=Brienomyrus brachyistius TaxID=42636 RepID=UPI0020B3F797|nr:zinc finger and BTB domain-containing protein 11 [Brienomyrus brachyistius]
MAGDCTHNTKYVKDDDNLGSRHALVTKGEPAGGPDAADAVKESTSKDATLSPYFEVIDGVLYRKKLEKGYIHYREVLGKDRRLKAIATFHHKRAGKRHHTLEDTYRHVAENYWWEGMYFQIREYVTGCRECQMEQEGREMPASSLVSKTLTTHASDMLCKLKGQWEEGLFCDITLRTGSRSFSAHRAVLAAVSEYFQEVFVEMASSPSPQSDIDLTGFSEESFLSLLEFSYTSTLSLKLENLVEVSTMARHFRMWPVVEACRAIQREQALDACSGGCTPDSPKPPRAFTSPNDIGSRKDGVLTKRKRKCGETEEGAAEESGPFVKRVTRSRGPLDILELPQGSGSGGSERTLRISADGNGFPCTPTRRLKLMDFKSPSNKRKTPPLRLPASQPPVRVLRSSPASGQRAPHLEADTVTDGGAASTTLPSPRSRKYKQRLCFPQASQEGTPVKQEPQEEEVQSPRTLEKYRLLSVLGLQRKSLLPSPEELTGWRQKKRLRKLKVDSYALTTRRKPRVPGLAGALNLEGSESNGTLLQRVIKMEPPDPVSLEDMRPSSIDRPLVATGGNTQGPVTLPKHSELRRSVRIKAPARSTELGSFVQIKPESTALPLLPPSTATRSQRRGHLPVEPLFSLKVKRSVVKSCPVDPRSTRVTRRTVRDARHGRRPAPSKARIGRDRARSHKRKEVKARAVAPHVEAPRKAARLTDGVANVRSVPGTSGLIQRPPAGLLRAIKDEPADPVPVCIPTVPELGKRQSKPPVKLLDPGFLFTFCRPIGAIKKEEEERVDICLTGSLSQPVNPSSPVRRIRSTADIAGRTRGAIREARAARRRARSLKQAEISTAVSPSLRRRSGPEGSTLNGFRGSSLVRPTSTKGRGEQPKKCLRLAPLQSRRSALLDSIRRARLKQLRQARGHAPVTSHTCFQCKVTYRNCDVLIMHRIRHIEGKHWPCPLCSKTFFRQRNVQSHIRTHDHKLYKCHRCLSAS